MVSNNKKKGEKVYFEILNKTQQQMSQIEKAMAGEYKDADFMLEITGSDGPFSPSEIESFVQNAADSEGEIQTKSKQAQLTDNENNCQSLDQVFNSVLMKRLSILKR